jgi:hypothetical protein
MESFRWSHLERRDLFLASRLLADGSPDGDWMQWVSDTLIYDLEIYNDPRQGVGFWLFQDEVPLVNDLGECLWDTIKVDPHNAAALLANPHVPLRRLASDLVDRIVANGRIVS